MARAEIEQSLTQYRRDVNTLPRVGLAIEEEKTLKWRILHGDESARQTVVEANIRLVMPFVVANRQRVNKLDLLQAGNLGLVMAAKRFEHVEPGKFGYYASACIKNQIAEEVYNQAPVQLPPEIWTGIGPFIRAEALLLQKFFREPTINEIAEELSISTQEALEISKGMKALDITRLHKPANQQGENDLIDYLVDRSDPLEDVIPQISTRDNQVETQKYPRLMKALNIFTPRQRQFLCMLSGVGDGIQRNLEDIAKETGFTPQYVGQAIKKVKKELDQEGPVKTLFSIVLSDPVRINKPEIVRLNLNRDIVSNVLINSYANPDFQDHLSRLLDQLTERQRFVLQWYIQGLTFKQIGAKIGVGEWPARNDYAIVVDEAKAAVANYLSC